jgi:hypothetical protein
VIRIGGEYLDRIQGQRIMSLHHTAAPLCFALSLTASLCVGCGLDVSDFSGSKASEGKVLTEADAQGRARTNLDNPKPTEAQLARKAKGMAAVQALGLPVLDTLPVVEDVTQVTPRTQEEIARRCLAVSVCAAKGESGDHELGRKLADWFQIRDNLSPRESEFLFNPKPSEQERIEFSWRHECGHVFLWALGYVDELKPPHETADIEAETKLIRDAGTKAFIDNSKQRSLDEILDANDYYYRLHWAVIELRLKGQVSPAANEEIIVERHRALNWLIRYMNQEWDDVTTDT